jgi:hypothetical protein
VLPKQSNPPDHGTSTSVLTDSTGKCGSSVLLGGDEIEALRGLFTLLDQWDREEANRGE